MQSGSLDDLFEIKIRTLRVFFYFRENVYLRHNEQRPIIEPTIAMKLQFYLRFHTEFGQTLWISGNMDELGNNDPTAALPMQYLDSEFWTATS